MRSIRSWPAHDSHTSPFRLAWGASLATSLFLVGCGPSPSFEDAVSGRTGADGATSLTIPVPPGESGKADLLVAVLGVQGNPNTSGPNGWTPVQGIAGFNGATCQADGQGTSCQLTVYYKITGGGETDASFTWGSTRRAAGAVLRFSNVDTDAPIGVARSQRGSSVGPTAPMVNTTRDGSHVLRVVVAELDEARPFLAGALALSDEPASSRINLVSFADASTDPTNGCGPPLSACNETERAIALAVSETRHSTAGASGPANWELVGGDQWVGASIEIKRPPGQ